MAVGTSGGKRLILTVGLIFFPDFNNLLEHSIFSALDTISILITNLPVK